MRIVPRLDEVEDGSFSFALRTKAMLNQQLTFERCVEALAHRVVVTVAPRPHRRSNTGCFAAKPERHRGVLGPLIGVVNDGERFAAIDGHIERIHDQLFAHMIRHCPSDDASAKDIEHNGEVQKAAPRRDVRYVGDPQLIGCVGDEAPFDKIGCRPGVAISNRRDRRLASRSPVNRPIAHQACDALGAYANTIFEQLRVNARMAIGRT